MQSSNIWKVLQCKAFFYQKSDFLNWQNSIYSGGGERSGRLGAPSFKNAVRAPFQSFALSFYIILLKSLLMTLEQG